MGSAECLAAQRNAGGPKVQRRLKPFRQAPVVFHADIVSGRCLFCGICAICGPYWKLDPPTSNLDILETRVCRWPVSRFV
jgi:hypothetical protein